MTTQNQSVTLKLGASAAEIACCAIYQQAAEIYERVHRSLQAEEDGLTPDYDEADRHRQMRDYRVLRGIGDTIRAQLSRQEVAQ